MSKYIKSAVLLILAAVPIIVVLMLAYGNDMTSDFETTDYYSETDNSNTHEIGYDSAEEIFDYSQVTTLSLGGLFFSNSVRVEVERFNSENVYYQIELSVFNAAIDPYTGALEVDYEVMREQNFDMIFGDFEAFSVYSFTPVDLYTFIDADIKLTREDFFPNAIMSLEAPDGTLPFITYGFIIETMISMGNVSEQVGSMTFENVFSALNNPSEPSFANFGLSYNFIINRALLTSGNNFVDLENRQANFNNVHFISALEIAANPSGIDSSLFGILSVLEAEWERFRRGDALFSQFWISHPEHLRRYQAILGDVAAVGIPTTTGGAHLIVPNRGIGINANSLHQEIAWSFARRFLLPTHNDGRSYAFLPMRIDLFDAHISELITPNIYNGVELPQELLWHGPRTPLHPIPLLIYAMTEDEAAEIRGIVESAKPALNIYRVIYTMIREEVSLFMANILSAEETAIIIQKRVQELLDTW
ncbi:MAG: hypothetical protein FWC13_02560 [Oscillospiraceae bacterium]|nr:hypothetical protein [Oscillospiraceae bacterium]